VKYRIENIAVPETNGLARPGFPGDNAIDLGHRRIVHVINVIENGTPNISVKVLTEEDD